jgi:hypothetical protein
MELNPPHKPVGFSLIFGEPAVCFHLIVEVPAAYVTGSQPTHTNLFQIALAAEPIQRRT